MADKPGRQSKGPRLLLPVRVPEDHAAVYESMWREQGFESRGDYLAAVLAEAHNLPRPSYVTRNNPNQQTLLSA